MSFLTSLSSSLLSSLSLSLASSSDASLFGKGAGVNPRVGVRFDKGAGVGVGGVDMEGTTGKGSGV